MNKPILYSTSCPKCIVLERKLEENNIEFDICSDTDVMLNLGFDQVPVLKVDGKYLEFKEAVDWINSRESK